MAVGIGSSPDFLGSSVMLRDDFRSTIWMIGSDFRVDATATVFLVRLPDPLRAAGRAVITLLLYGVLPLGLLLYILGTPGRRRRRRAAESAAESKTQGDAGGHAATGPADRFTPEREEA